MARRQVGDWATILKTAHYRVRMKLLASFPAVTRHVARVGRGIKSTKMDYHVWSVVYDKSNGEKRGGGE